MKKRGQLKIQQMAFMLMAVVLFFILAGLFWLSIQYVQLHKQANLNERERAIIVSSFLAGSAEFTCGDYCVDSDRMLVLGEVEAYKKFLWPYAYIIIKKLGREDKIECTKANYPNCNTFTILDKGKESVGEAETFIALCRKESYVTGINEKCELGKIKIGYEVK